MHRAHGFDVFRNTTNKEIAPLLIPCHKARGAIAHRLKPFQLKRKMRGHFFAAWSLICGIRGQQ